eukprot:1434560-Rhodomonas_salina.1
MHAKCGRVVKRRSICSATERMSSGVISLCSVSPLAMSNWHRTRRSNVRIGPSGCPLGTNEVLDVARVPYACIREHSSALNAFNKDMQRFSE